MTIFSLGKEAMSDEHYINLLFFTPSSSRRLSFSHARKRKFKGDVYKNNGCGVMTWRMLGSVVGALRSAFFCVLNMQHISVKKCLPEVSCP